MARTLLIVHHTPSPPMRELLESVLAGAHDPEISGVDVRSVPALGATVPDVLAADGFLFGTPANFGYMSGALKHFFDTVYYPSLDAVSGKPYGAWVYGNSDTAGAGRAIESIAAVGDWTRLPRPLTWWTAARSRGSAATNSAGRSRPVCPTDCGPSRRVRLGTLRPREYRLSPTRQGSGIAARRRLGSTTEFPEVVPANSGTRV